MEKDKTRLFFVVDSIEDNEEIFETLEDAQAYLLSAMDIESKPRLYIAMVRNTYREDDGHWNYEDFSDTFTIVKKLN